jgi:NAD(P)-dependent dehydrogenase (short-subunit alcohol dehydrogenase family)
VSARRRNEFVGVAAPPLQSLLDFRGRVAIVTGSAAGIGEGIARRLAEAGAAVLIHYRANEQGAGQLRDRIAGEGGRVATFGADLTREGDVERLVAFARDALGSPDVLVNNAGAYPLASIAEMTEAEWDAVVDANLKSVHLTTRAVSRAMIASGRGGAIVNIASIEAGNVAPRHAHYQAAKAGVLMYTRAAAREFGSDGIRVNAVSPGLIWREGLDEAWRDGVRRYLSAVPLGRLGMAADVADACLFLASAAARWITGAELIVDGGVLTNAAF